MTYIDDETDATIRELWKVLPQAAKDAVTSDRYKKVVRDALGTHTLSDEQLTTVQHEVLLLLLTLQTEDEFIAILPEVSGLAPQDTHTAASYILSSLPIYTAQTPAQKQHDTTILAQYIESNQKAKSRLEKLPANVRSVISSKPLSDAFTSAANASGLQGEQVAALGTHVALVLVGLTTTKELGEQLTHVLKLSDQDGKKIIELLTPGVLTPVRKALLEALQKKQGGEGKVNASATG